MAKNKFDRHTSRGKQLYDGEWAYGYFIASGNDKAHFIRSGDWPHQVDPATIGQCTGLFDCKGSAIFEGDIIQCNEDPKDLSEVRFGEFKVRCIETEEAIDHAVGWFIKPIATDAFSRLAPFYYEMPLNSHHIGYCKMEVIGNAHDNPELLQEV